MRRCRYVRRVHRSSGCAASVVWFADLNAVRQLLSIYPDCMLLIGRCIVGAFFSLIRYEPGWALKGGRVLRGMRADSTSLKANPSVSYICRAD